MTIEHVWRRRSGVEGGQDWLGVRASVEVFQAPGHEEPSRADREQEGSSLFFVQLPTNFRGRWPRARGGRTAFPRSCGAREKRQ
ncbi:unnamed protein product, partial [Ectocarpus fasciculatus]